MRMKLTRAVHREVSLNGSMILASIKGTVMRTGVNYRGAKVYAINKATRSILPIKLQDNGNYELKGIARNSKFIIIAEDLLKKFNAVIQDNVVPK